MQHQLELWRIYISFKNSVFFHYRCLVIVGLALEEREYLKMVSKSIFLHLFLLVLGVFASWVIAASKIDVVAKIRGESHNHQFCIHFLMNYMDNLNYADWCHIDDASSKLRCILHLQQSQLSHNWGIELICYLYACMIPFIAKEYKN